jgi:hypothetical protein
MKKIECMEEKCVCGFSIPRGYGYYDFGKGVKCFGCGRINYRSHIETVEEFSKKLEETLI